MTHYLLNKDKSVTPCSMDEWGSQYNDMCKSGTRHVADEEINGYRISTVWLGTDHDFYGNGPLIFETMIFPKNDYSEIYMDRYGTWDEAVLGHEKAKQWLLNNKELK
jgi:hypothetical protein